MASAPPPRSRRTARRSNSADGDRRRRPRGVAPGRTPDRNLESPVSRLDPDPAPVPHAEAQGRGLAGPGHLGVEGRAPARDGKPHLGVIRAARRGLGLRGPIRGVRPGLHAVSGAGQALAGGRVFRGRPAVELGCYERAVSHEVEHGPAAGQPQGIGPVLDGCAQGRSRNQVRASGPDRVSRRPGIEERPGARTRPVSGLHHDALERYRGRVRIPQLHELVALVRTLGVVEHFVQKQVGARARRWKNRPGGREEHGGETQDGEWARHGIPLLDARRGESAGTSGGRGRRVRGSEISFSESIPRSLRARAR